MSLKPTWSAKQSSISKVVTQRDAVLENKSKAKQKQTNKQDDGASNMGQSWPGRVNSTGARAGAESDQG